MSGVEVENWNHVPVPKTEETPLLLEQPQKSTIELKVPPSAQKRLFVPNENMPDSIPFQKLLIPFHVKLPLSVVTEGEELKQKIGQKSWDKLINDAHNIGEKNEKIELLYSKCNGLFVYLCLPCFFFCYYKPADESVQELGACLISNYYISCRPCLTFSS